MNECGGENFIDIGTVTRKLSIYQKMGGGGIARPPLKIITTRQVQMIDKIFIFKMRKKFLMRNPAR